MPEIGHFWHHRTVNLHIQMNARQLFNEEVAEVCA